MDYKLCFSCKKIRPKDNFCKESAKKDGLSPNCRRCFREISKNSRKKLYDDTYKCECGRVIQRLSYWDHIKSKVHYYNMLVGDFESFNKILIDAY